MDAVVPANELTVSRGRFLPLVLLSRNGTQVVLEAPFRNVFSAFAAGLVRETEVDAKQNAAIDDLLYGLREACVVSWILNRRCIRGRHSELHAVGFEEMLEGIHRGA